MGGSSSSSSSTQSTDQRDERIAASDQAVVLRLDSNNQLSLSEASPEVLEGAGEILEVALGGAGEALADLLSFTQSETAAERALVGQSLRLVEERTQSEGAGTLEKLMRAGTVIAVVGAAAWAAPKLLKG